MRKSCLTSQGHPVSQKGWPYPQGDPTPRVTLPRGKCEMCHINARRQGEVKWMQSWLTQGSSGGRVTLLPEKTFIHVNTPLTHYFERPPPCFRDDSFLLSPRSIQLTHHHNIQRSTLRLRELSKPAENEQTTSQPPVPASHDHSQPRTTGQGEYERWVSNVTTSVVEVVW